MKKINFDLLRKSMVEDQLAQRGISNIPVLEAFNKVQRHRFVPSDKLEEAYTDHPLPIGNGQTISQPYIVALMTERLDLTGKEKVLEIGTGSGYQTAILSELAKEVYTIERVADLSEKARELLKGLGYKNINYKVSDGTRGWEEKSPFDRIIITAYCPEVPAPLTRDLNESGKMVLPLGDSFSQMLTLVEKINGKLYYQDICPCVFVPLVGAYGAKPA